MAHTKGTWVIEDEGYGCKNIGVIDEDGVFQGHAMTDGVDESEDLANARLIIASPIMLDALESILAGAENAGLFSGDSMDPDWYVDTIQAAINTARR